MGCHHARAVPAGKRIVYRFRCIKISNSETPVLSSVRCQQLHVRRPVIPGWPERRDSSNSIHQQDFQERRKNYFTTEKELLAIVQCLKKFRIYILGQPLTIITDNKALTFIKKCHLNNTRITRWILAIQEYNFEILHCKGKENIVADILSRYPEDEELNEPLDERQEYYLSLIHI